MVASYINQARETNQSFWLMFLLIKTQPEELLIMPTLREKMKQEMILFGLAKSTQKRYMQVPIKLYQHYCKSPAKLSVDELKDYLMTLKKRI